MSAFTKIRQKLADRIEPKHKVTEESDFSKGIKLIKKSVKNSNTVLKIGNTFHTIVETSPADIGREIVKRSRNIKETVSSLSSLRKELKKINEVQSDVQ